LWVVSSLLGRTAVALLARWLAFELDGAARRGEVRMEALWICLPVGGTGDRRSPEEEVGRAGSNRWRTWSELLEISRGLECRLFGDSQAVGREDVEK
jgi:hypothetical protein